MLGSSQYFYLQKIGIDHDFSLKIPFRGSFSGLKTVSDPVLTWILLWAIFQPKRYEDSGCSRFWKRFPALENTTFKFITSGDVQQVLAANGIESELFQQKSSVNIDCCYDKDNNNDAEHVADFLTQALHFQKTAPPDFVEEVLSYVAEPECSFKKGGELYFNNDWAAVVVTKNGVLQK